MSVHISLAPCSSQSRLGLPRFSLSLCFKQQRDFCGQVRTPQGRPLCVEPTTVRCCPGTSCLYEECLPSRSVARRELCHTQLAGLTQKWFPPLGSLVLSGMVLWTRLVQGRTFIPAPCIPNPCIISGRQMSSLLVALLHHGLWRCCSSLLLGSSVTWVFSCNCPKMLPGALPCLCKKVILGGRNVNLSGSSYNNMIIHSRLQKALGVVARGCFYPEQPSPTLPFLTLTLT